MKVLITGAGSYVGESVKKYILATSTDFEIDSVDMMNDSWKQTDFTKYDVVFHVAGIAHVNASRCIGCGLCASVCPKNVISMVPHNTGTVMMCNSKDKGAEARKACKNACISCTKCEKTCPNGAIKVENNLAVINYEKCTNCGTCVAGCPTGCLKNVFSSDIGE